MLITQTPYRVSFAGGGTDLAVFYEHDYGAVLSAAINQHMYVTVSPRFDETVRVSYTQTEITELENAVDDCFVPMQTLAHLFAWSDGTHELSHVV